MYRRLYIILLILSGLLTGCATTLHQVHQPESYALPPKIDAQAWSALKNEKLLDREESGFTLLDYGPEALCWRLALVDTAVSTIDAQYFIWKLDKAGSLLLERLLAAADRGVRVRMLIDDVFLSGEDAAVLAVDSHPNVEVRVFNPYQVRSSSMIVRFLKNVNDFERINHRMHNKLLVADNQAAILGGRNIADEYFGFGSKENFRDMDVLCIGNIVPQLSDAFDTYWNSGWAFPVTVVLHKRASAEQLAQLHKDLQQNASAMEAWIKTADASYHDWNSSWVELAKNADPGRASVVYDNPDIEGGKPEDQVAGRLKHAMAKAQDEILIATAYLVPTQGFMESIRSLTARGVRVRILTNSLASTNHISAHTGYRHHRKELVKAKVELHELRPDAAIRAQHEAQGHTAKIFGLHAKVVVIDRRRVFIGTLNIDPLSFMTNTEMDLLIDSPAFAADVHASFDRDFDSHNCWRVDITEDGNLQWVAYDETLSRQPAGSVWRRLGDSILGLFPLESEL
jgi:putative cardiolipin synthase